MSYEPIPFCFKLESFTCPPCVPYDLRDSVNGTLEFMSIHYPRLPLPTIRQIGDSVFLEWNQKHVLAFTPHGNYVSTRYLGKSSQHINDFFRALARD